MITYHFESVEERKAVVDTLCFMANDIEADYRKALRRRSADDAFKALAKTIRDRELWNVRKAISILDSLPVEGGAHQSPSPNTERAA